MALSTPGAEWLPSQDKEVFGAITGKDMVPFICGKLNTSRTHERLRTMCQIAPGWYIQQLRTLSTKHKLV